MSQEYRSPASRLLPVALLASVLAGCEAESSAGPRAWIDVPIHGSVLPAGREIEVQSHAFSPEGVAEILLVVNGVPYRRDPAAEPGAAFTRIRQTWMPDGPGDYSLQVVAYDGAGGASRPGEVWVTVLEMTPTSAPTATSEPTPTPIRMAEVSFIADNEALAAGECTLLHWEVRHADAVRLDGEAVEAAGSILPRPARCSRWSSWTCMCSMTMTASTAMSLSRNRAIRTWSGFLRRGS